MPDRIEHVSGQLIRSIQDLAFGDPEGAISVTQLTGGSINATFQVELRDRSSVILRIAPSEAAAVSGPSWLTPWGLRREQAVIALAAPALGSLLPGTIAADFDHTLIDRDWIIQERMPGVPFSTVVSTLPSEERAAVWIELGRLARRLHATTGERFGEPVAGPQFDRLSDLLRNDAVGLLDDAERFELPIHAFRRLRDRIDEVGNIFDDNPGPRLVHSDLTSSHVFVQPVGEEDHYHVSGIIDLEFGRFADARSEGVISSFQCGNAPMEMKEAFFAGYGRYFDTPEDRLRLRIYAALALAWSATILAFHDHRESLPGVIVQLEEALARSE